MSSLLTICGRNFGVRFPIEGELTFGRATSATVLLTDLQVSRLHAVIRETDGACVLHDASSRNGTFVNGDRIRGPVTLEPEDEIQIGSSRFVFDATEECYAEKYGSSWLIVGGGTGAFSDLFESGEESTQSELPSATLHEDALSLTEWLNSCLGEEELARSVLGWMTERFEADRGTLISLRPEGLPQPLAISATHQHLSLNRILFKRCVSGSSVHFTGEVELSRFGRGRRKVGATALSILAVPWRVGGEIAGLLWLERDARGQGYSEHTTERVACLLKTIGPAIENARLRQILSRRQRRDLLLEESERISGRMLLEHAGLWERARAMAATHKSIAVIGPRGAGKDRVATTLHAFSMRWEGPLVQVNCARLSAIQAELELFGAETGVIPGSDEPYIGKLELAGGGTLVLELVEALAPAARDVLYRALRYGSIVRKGGDRPIPIDVRIISTSGRPLEYWVRNGRLRPELAALLGEEKLPCPGLGELKTGILPLALALISKLSIRLSQSNVDLSEGAREALLNREWTLNLWELEDLITRAMALSDDDILTQEDLDLGDVILARAARPEVVQPDLAHFREVEKRLLVQALRVSRGRRAEAARLLGITHGALERKLLDHEIQPGKLK